MFPDYYAILGVKADADLESIRQAYKRRAFECHPDRGGSHEQMVRINAAWEILRDPSNRQRYDYARSHAQDPAAEAATNEDSRQARERAQQYPQRWSDFEVWLENVSKDFAQAEYKNVDGPLNTKWPVITGSDSGILFVVAGGLIGFLISAWFAYIFATSPLTGHHVGTWGSFFARLRPMVLILIGGPSLGALLGAQIHKGIGIVLKSAMRAGSNSTAIVRCAQCRQQLRVPNGSGKWEIKCPKCSHKFSHTGAVA
ncbi:MAG TPA: DnaJ domain-containing protein [Planctomycetaceae bacterium]|jgi:DNA-directed RNA polymerase subunit RPC12/RpoP